MKKRFSMLLVCMFTVGALLVPATASADLLLDPCYFADGTEKIKDKCN